LLPHYISRNNIIKDGKVTNIQRNRCPDTKFHNTNPE